MSINYPNWAKEIENLVGVYNQFFLSGNVRDYYEYSVNDSIKFNTLEVILKNVLKNKGKYIALFKMNPSSLQKIEGELLVDNTEVTEKLENYIKEELKYGYEIKETRKRFEVTLTSSNNRQQSRDNLLKPQIDFLKKILDNSLKDFNIAVIYDFSDFIDNIHFKESWEKLFYEMYVTGTKLKPNYYKETKERMFNLLIWIFDESNKIPNVFLKNTHFSKNIIIPKPTLKIKKDFLRLRISNITGENIEKYVEIIANNSVNLDLKDLDNILEMAKKKNVDISQIEDLVKFYRLGITENPWKDVEVDKLKKAEEFLSKKVIGQNYAVKKVSEVIKRAYFNLSGVQFSKNTMRPKGVLFFAGPTGVGKTELAKSVAELIFGNVENYIRFDMSEFSKEHSDQRLIGAPPGYVGYEQGGELVNKIKENPFTVILFDEIEKAHQKILDIFLQILDEGHLTSARGETVYFSESIVIFTSNLGVYDEDEITGKKKLAIDPEKSYEEIQKIIKDKIKSHFINIGRPEILNRIGENIIVFDFIRKDAGKKILEKMLTNIKEVLLKNNNIEFEIEEQGMQKLYEYCLEDLSMGGRGIGNQLEKVLLNPLSEKLFQFDISYNNNKLTKVVLKDIRLIDEKNEFYDLELEVK